MEITEKLAHKNKTVMAIIVIVFLGYNFFIYTQKPPIEAQEMSELAIYGQQIYQDKNCTSCHQFYGLGGYLGPDLTNVISAEGKGTMYVKAFLNSGVKSMPQFNFSEEEKEALIAFLEAVDETGHYPIYETAHNFGWVSIKYKK